MDDVVFREMEPADVPGAVALRNEVFADYPVTAADWAADGMRASVAVQGGEIVGAIPLVMRELVVAPGVRIDAPFENSVGTRAVLRSRGLGAGMIDAARGFMRERADGLFVYRGGERTQGYRFYAKTGHHDLMATRSYVLADPGGGTPPAGLEGREAIAAAGERLLPLFASTYGSFGGYPRRTASSWRRALASSVFAEMPTAFSLIPIARSDDLAGYALVGVRTAHPDGRVHVLEMATRAADLAVAGRVLEAVAAFAGERGLSVEMAVADDDPFGPALRAAGYVGGPRGTFLMGQLIDPATIYRRRWRERVPLGGVGLVAATEERDHVLSEPERSFPTLTLEMKEATLHRWLLGRIDLAARLREGTVTAYGVHGPLLPAVCAAIPWTPWAFHSLDWI